MDRNGIILHPIETEFQTFRELYADSFQTDNPLLKSVFDYLLQRKGKMMRPILVLLVAKEFGPITQATYHAALTLEMLHSASLIHDDVVDNSSERRGQKSVNAIYDNRISVLIGDYMLSAALQHSAKTNHIEVVNAISQLGRDLSEGEILQLSNIRNQELSEVVYFDIIRMKTAALFSTCAKAGALTAPHATREDVERFRLFGEKVGVCFQIKDDIFDYYKSDSVGKPTGNDMLEGKLTLPALYAVSHTNRQDIKDLVVKVKSLQATAEDVETLTRFTKDNGGIEYAEQVMMRYKQEALLLLTEVKNNAVREALTAYVTYVIEREV